MPDFKSPTNPEAASSLYTPFNQISGSSWMGVGADLAGTAINAASMAKQKLPFSGIAPTRYDSNSAPVYTAGQLNNEVSGVKAKGASGGELANSALKGFSAGMATGNPFVAVGAGLVSLAATGIGGKIKKTKQQHQLDAKHGEVTMAQNQFNQEAADYKQQQNQLYDYYNQSNAEGREYNVLRSRMIT